MSLILSTPPPFGSAASRRQRWTLLMASAAIHVALLVPVALNQVTMPEWVPSERTFEVWLEMARPEPPPRIVRDPVRPVQDQRTPPTPPIIQARQRMEQTPVEPVRPVDTPPLPQPVPPAQRAQPEEQVTSVQLQSPLTPLQGTVPSPVPQPAMPSEALSGIGAPSPVAELSPVPALSVVPRPHIEAVDGPARDAPVRPLDSSNRMPSVADTPAGDTASTRDDPDAPVPRRARMTAEEEAALAAAAASGALDDAWVYRPTPGEQAGGWPPAAGGTGTGSSASAGTATFRGTPVDCTQPQMLSDIQRLSCDSAEARRIRSAIERGVQVMGTGDAEGDARNASEGQQRLNDFERRRQPLRAGVGISQGSMLGGSERGEVLDEMSGTNREVQKLQDAMRRSNAQRPPANPDDAD